MNERIKVLKQQAEEYTGDYGIKHQVFGQALIDVLDERFAELIIKDCIICVEREWIRNGDTEHNRAVSKVIESIKEHFEIKE